jgi:hypothetical protein
VIRSFESLELFVASRSVRRQRCSYNDLKLKIVKVADLAGAVHS